MKSSWTKGLDEQQQADIVSSYNASTLMRRRLVEILKDKIETSNKTARSKVTYDNPNWAYLQADAVGYERAIYDIIDLL